MLQDLQYLVGTSIAELCDVADLTKVHSVVGGPMANGSSFPVGGGKGCKLRGRICNLQSATSV
jgi:hypothetical protein